VNYININIDDDTAPITNNEVLKQPDNSDKNNIIEKIISKTIVHFDKNDNDMSKNIKYYTNQFNYISRDFEIFQNIPIGIIKKSCNSYTCLSEQEYSIFNNQYDDVTNETEIIYNYLNREKKVKKGYINNINDLNSSIIKLQNKNKKCNAELSGIKYNYNYNF
jgi:hypothetical protein